MIPNYCEKCGSRYPEDLLEHTCLSEVINIRCPACKNDRDFHPVPIAVLLQPVVTNAGETGLLIKKIGGIDGQDRYVELPSCFFHIGEDTKQILIRRTGIDSSSDTLRDFAICTDRHDKYLYLFFVNEKVFYEKDLLENDENDQKMIITGYAKEQFAFSFSLEQEMVKRYFNQLWYEEPE